MKQRAIKMPDELWAKVQAEAEKIGLTAGLFVRLAVEEKLGVEDLETVEEVHHHTPEQVAGYAGLPKPQARVVSATTAVVASTLRFKCRVPSCDFRAASSKAFCPNHPGPLLPV